MENNHSMSRVERSRREKVTRYSVRKVSFGAASVAVAAFFYVFWEMVQCMQQNQT